MTGLVFGANGYLGCHLSTFLKEKGWTIHNYDIHSDSQLPNYSPVNILEKGKLDLIDWNVDFVFCFWGLTGTVKGFQSYQSFIDVNEIGLLNLLDAVKNSGCCPRIIYPSTRLIYKGSDCPLDENSKKECRTIYAVNKLSCEYLLQTYQISYNIPYTVFRICVPYGNALSNKYSYGTVGFFLQKAIQKEPITLYGDGLLRRTFSYVLDICEQIYLCINSVLSLNEAYNIGGETFSLLDVAKIFSHHFGIRIKFTEWPESDWKIESGNTIFDDTKIKKVIGDFSYHSLEALNWLS